MHGPVPTVTLLGDVLTDILVRPSTVLTYGGDTRAAIAARPGGSGANQAAWLASLGVTVDLIGKIGQDAFGIANAQSLTDIGVRAHLVRDVQHPTGTVIVLIAADGERTMLTDRGASRNVQPEDVPPELFGPQRHLHLSGYVLLDEPTRPAALHALRLARDQSMTISVDPVAATLIDEVGADRFLEWTDGAQLCFPNLVEARALVGQGTPEELAQRLCLTYSEVALKMGSQGALAQKRHAAPLWQPAQPAEALDTTGAGDAFCAGYLSQWLQHKPTAACLVAGAEAGARAITGLGGRLP